MVAFLIALSIFPMSLPFRLYGQNATAAHFGLAPVPPMGWASWNHYFCDYNEQTIRKQADALVSTGMRELGYEYVVIQECIAPGRDNFGNLIVDSNRFPHGLKALVDYIHARGLKAGIYTDVGPYTCYPKPRYQGSFNHEEKDADTFASWGMDLIEMDYCNKPAGQSGRAIYQRMGDAIHKTGRPMVFYICSWGEERPWEWAQGIAQLWRTGSDISLVKNRVEWSHVVQNFESNARHAVFSAPDSWNDPDMLEVGTPGLTALEGRTHFSMWAISAAPLLAGADLTHMDANTRATLTNKEVIAVDQDPLGAGPEKISGHSGGVEVWAKPLESRTSGLQAVLLLNQTSSTQHVSIRWSDLGLASKVRVRDIWTHIDLGQFFNQYSAEVPAHGSQLLKVSGLLNWKNGAVFEAEWPGNVRQGGTRLLVCSNCSQGFGVSIGAINGQTSGSLSFKNVSVDKTGHYKIELTCVRNGSGNRTILVRLNHAPPLSVTAPTRERNWTTIPVILQDGVNTITVSYAGKGTFNIDKMRLIR